MATDATAAASRPPGASMVFIWIGRGPSCKAPGRHRGTLARPGVSVTSRAGPGLDFYRGDEPGGIRKRQSVTRQSDRFKLGRPGEVGLSGPCPLHLQSSSVPAVGGRLGCMDISVTTLQKVTGVIFAEKSRGDVVEALFFVTAVLLRSTIDLVMIVLVFGSALLVVLSKKFDR